MISKNFKSLSFEAKKEFLNSFDTILTDCDGVLWIDETIIEGASTVVNMFKACRKKIFLVTNNCSRTRRDYVDLSRRYGFKTDEDDIITPGWLTAQYLRRKNFSEKVYLAGPKSVEKELSDVKIECFGCGPDAVDTSISPLHSIDNIVLKQGVGAVLIGPDIHFSYIKLVKACTYLLNPHCEFISTNNDRRYPSYKNLVSPGTGSLVAAVETVTQRKALLLGKPSSYMVDELLKIKGFDPKRTLIIGDSCDTDIYIGTKSGMTTLLVLTGVTSLSDLETYSQNDEHHLIPTYFTDSIADLISLFE